MTNCCGQPMLRGQSETRNVRDIMKALNCDEIYDTVVDRGRSDSNREMLDDLLVAALGPRAFLRVTRKVCAHCHLAQVFYEDANGEVYSRIFGRAKVRAK